MMQKAKSLLNPGPLAVITFLENKYNEDGNINIKPAIKTYLSEMEKIEKINK
mgnify:CR=1 FL=1